MGNPNPGIPMQEYRVTLQNGTEKTAIRTNIKGVADDYENDVNPVVQIQRTKTGLDVRVPEPPKPVYFTVSVTPQSAVDAACVAAPTNFTVENGTKVVFQALPSAGWDFVGWFLDAPFDPEDEVAAFNPAVPISTEETAVIPVTIPAPGQTRRIEARFAPEP